MSKKGSTGRKRKKKKSQSGSNKGCISAIVLLLVVALALYMYSRYYRQTHPVASEQTSSIQSGHASGSDEKSCINRQSGTEGQKSFSKSSNAAVTGKKIAYEALDIALALTPRHEQLIRHTGYTVSYNSIWRLPNWVGYELTRQETRGKENRSDRFIADPLARGAIATNSDYTRSGYDKGHMAPAADMKWDAQVMKESFYFTNICPQHPELNRRRWKDLEEKIRDWAIADSAIIIVCGPIVNDQPRTLGKNKVAVPQKFFKVILSPYLTSPKAIAFLFDNQRSVDPLRSYVVTVDSIERLTGLDFFAPLPDELEDRIEARADCLQWGL